MHTVRPSALCKSDLVVERRSITAARCADDGAALSARLSRRSFPAGNLMKRTKQTGQKAKER